MSDLLGLGPSFPSPVPAPTPTFPEVYIAGEEPPEPEYDEYGWLRAGLKFLGDWLVENVIRPILQGAVWLIDWIRAELRYWTYEAIKWLTEVTATSEGLIATLAIVFAMAVLVPQAVEWFGTTSVGVLVKKIVEWTKEKIGRILEAVHFVDLIAIHEVLLIVWPKWREVFVPFQDAVSALAEQLGQGTGYIHAWLSVTHSMSMVGTSLLNLDPKIGEIRALESSQTFMAKLDQKFRSYSHDPGLIARDIIEDIYIPYAEEIRDTQTSTIDSIKDGRDYMLNLNEQLRSLDDSLQYLVAATLPEFREQMAENLQGIRDVVNQYSKWIEETILPNMDLSIRVLSDRADILERSNAIARAKLDNPIEIFMATEFTDEATQLATWDYLYSHLNVAESRAIEEIVPTFDTLTEGMVDATADRFIETPPVVQPPRAALSLELPAVPPLGTVPGWYRGED